MKRALQSNFGKNCFFFVFFQFFYYLPKIVFCVLLEKEMFVRNIHLKKFQISLTILKIIINKKFHQKKKPGIGRAWTWN